MLGRHVYRVTERADEWIVRKDGEAAARGARPDRAAALAYACALAAVDEPSRVVVETAEGTLADERVFGTDPGLGDAG